MMLVRFYGGPLDGLMVETDGAPLRADEKGQKLDVAQGDHYRLVASSPAVIPTYVWSSIYGRIAGLDQIEDEAA
jgi:hypothetical protein